MQSGFTILLRGKMKLVEIIKKEALILIAFVALTLIVFVLYHPGANGPYMLDDYVNIKNNTSLKMEEFNISSLLDATFSMRSGILYRPVAMLSFTLNYYFTGNIDGYPIKLINIFIHILTAWGVFLLTLLLLRRMEKTGSGVDQHDGEQRWTGPVALFIAALWLLHPLHVSTVLYTVQRMTELSAMFSFYAAIAYVKGRNDLLKGEQGGLWWVLGAVGIGSILATLSKENGALLPLLLLVIEGIFYRFKFHPDIHKSSKRWIYGAIIFPSVGLLIYLIGLVIVMPEGLYSRDFTLIQRLITESRVIFFYLRLIFLPDIRAMGLNHDDFGISTGLLSPPATILSLIGIAILLAVALYGVRKNRFPVLSFSILWFLAGHLLESTVVQLELVYEHRNYLPAYGPLFAAGYYINHYLFSANRILRGIKYVVPLLILILLAIPLKERIGHWSMPSKFFFNELKNHPKSARNFVELANGHVLAQQYPRAFAAYQTAARLNPNETGLLLAGLEILVHKMNKVPQEEIIDMIESSLRNNKITSYTVEKLITFAGNNLKRDEGNNPVTDRTMVERLLVAAIANRYPWPNDSKLGETYFMLAELRFRQSRLEDAAAALEKTVSLIPMKYDARIGLLRIYLTLNKITEAEEQIKQLEDAALDPSRQMVIAGLRQDLTNLKTVEIHRR